MARFKIEVPEYGEIPAWWGIGYWNMFSRSATCFPIPLCWIVYIWHHIRTRLWLLIRPDTVTQMYWQGYRAGRESMSSVSERLDRFEKNLRGLLEGQERIVIAPTRLCVIVSANEKAAQEKRAQRDGHGEQVIEGRQPL